MSIRYRLAAVIALVVLPVLVAVTLVLAVAMPSRVGTSQAHGLDVAARSVASAMAFECGALGYRAQLIALDVANGRAPAQVLTAQRSGRTDADSYDVVAIEGQDPVTRGRVEGESPTTLPAPRCSDAPAAIDRARNGVPLLVERATVATTGGAITVISVERITPAWVEAVRARLELDDTNVSLACPTGGAASPLGARDARYSEVAAERGQPCIVRAGATTVAGDGYRTWAVLLLVPILLAALGLVLWLANALTRPIRSISAAARRTTAGERDVRVDIRTQDEIGELGRDFNVMVDELDGLITEAERGRDALRDTSRRLGDVLKRTHDLDGMLTALCALAETTAGATCASVWMTEGSGLRVRTVHPIGSARPAARRVEDDTALPMAAAHAGTTRSTDAAAGDPSSVLGARMVALPLVSGDRTLGVLVAERPADAPPFDDDEVERLELAIGSAGIAVDNAMLHRAAQRQSVVDPLTGVGNMRYLMATLGREIERGKRFDRDVAVLVVDIDNFRRLNEELGPSVGDGVLTALAAHLNEHVRSVDTVARYGGEEFAVVCPELGPANAEVAARRLVDSVREATLEVLDVQVRLTVSVGVACYPVHGHAAQALVAAADDAMVTAKTLGRDRAVIAPVAP